PDEYARQLDALQVELGIVQGKNMAYASKFSSAQPQVRTGSGAGDGRLYFLWQGRGRKTSDVALLKKAGLTVGDADIFQFYPDWVETRLAELEVRYKGRQPAEIRVTRFSVVPRGNSYDFSILAQETLR